MPTMNRAAHINPDETGEPVTSGSISMKVFSGSERSSQSPGHVHSHEIAPQTSENVKASLQLNPFSPPEGHSKRECPR